MLEGPKPRFDDPHFLAVVARVMRQVLVDHARGAAAQKRGGGDQRITWNDNLDNESADLSRQLRLLEVDRALTSLAQTDASLGRLVEMLYFGGMTAEEVALVVNSSAHAVRHDLRAARAWLRREMAGE